MILDFKKLFVICACFFIGSSLVKAAQLDTVNVADVKPYEVLPTDPAGVSEIVIEQLLRANARDYHPIGFYGRKSSYGMNNHVQYSVVSLWAWAIENIARDYSYRMSSCDHKIQLDDSPLHLP